MSALAYLLEHEPAKLFASALFILLGAALAIMVLRDRLRGGEILAVGILFFSTMPLLMLIDVFAR